MKLESCPTEKKKLVNLFDSWFVHNIINNKKNKYDDDDEKKN